MKKSTLIKLVVIVTMIIGIVVVNGESFGFKKYVAKTKRANVEQLDSIHYPNLLEEVVIIGKVPVK